MQSEFCQHDFNKEDTSVYFNLKTMRMVFPNVIKGLCLVCGKNFDVLKENGEYREVTNV